MRGYLSQGLLVKTRRVNEDIRQIFINNSAESLKVAGLLSENRHSDLWTIVCSYYSMYYIAKAVLYSLGYSVGEKISHRITADALITIVKKKLKESLLEDYEYLQDQALSIADVTAEDIVESFDLERRKRSRVQYNTTEDVKRTKAETSLKRARVFVFEMRKLLM